jgi:hypothetical protein
MCRLGHNNSTCSLEVLFPKSHLFVVRENGITARMSRGRTSMIRVRTGVIDTGLKSVGSDAVETLAIGRIKACFHCNATVEVDSERLKSRVVGSLKSVAPILRNQAGS